jgi:integrase
MVSDRAEPASQAAQAPFPVGPVDQVVATARALIETGAARRRGPLLRALAALQERLTGLPPERCAGLPIELQRGDVKAMRRTLGGHNPESATALTRLASLSKLLEELESAGCLAVKPLRVSVHRLRPLAADMSADTFRDVARLSTVLTPALLGALARSPSGVELECIALIALVWDGPVVLSRAVRRLLRLRVGDYDPRHGTLRVPFQDASALVAGQPGDEFTRVFLRSTARVVLNFLLLQAGRRGGDPRLGPGDLLFPSLATMSVGEATAMAVRHLARYVLPDQAGGAPSMSLRRLVRAARRRALDIFPPVIVSWLSGHLTYAPTTDDILRQLEQVAPSHFVPEAGSTPAIKAGPMDSAVAELPEPADLPAESGGLSFAYLEACEGLRAVQRRLERRDAATDRTSVRALAQSVLGRLEREVRTTTVDVPPNIANLASVLRWVVWQLQFPHGTRQLRQENAMSTIAIRVQPLRSLIELWLPDTRLGDLNEDGWVDFVLNAMGAPVRTPKARTLMRKRLKALYAYLYVYENRPDRPMSRVNWANPDLSVAARATAQDLLLPWEINDVRTSLAEGTKARGPLLDIFILLAAYAGLRLSEACGLHLRQVHLGNETLIRVGVSKTASGTGRWIPLHLLLPREDLERFRRFYANRLREAIGDPEALLLATADRPTAFDPKELARRVSRELKKRTGKRVTYHSLRHSFASLFPLRWFVAFHGREAAGSLKSLLDTPLFSEEALLRFRQLFGSLNGNRPFEILSVLLGHSGPDVTVTSYTHTLDWLQRLYIDRECAAGKEPRLSIRQAAAVLKLSLPSAYQRFPQAKKGRGIECSTAALRQAQSIGRRAGQGSRHPPAASSLGGQSLGETRDPTPE